MDTKSLVVEGKKIGSTSEFLDNFYASLPSRFLHQHDSFLLLPKQNMFSSGQVRIVWLLFIDRTRVRAREDSMDGTMEEDP